MAVDRQSQSYTLSDYGGAASKPISGRKMTPTECVRRFEELKARRQTWEYHWQELAEYIMPDKSDITVVDYPGVKKNVHLFDNTAMMSNELLAGEMHGQLTNPAVKWFELTTGDINLDNMGGVRRWMQEVEWAAHGIINGSNFQTEVHQFYLDLTCFGTASMSIEEDDETIVRFRSRHIRNIYFRENAH